MKKRQIKKARAIHLFIMAMLIISTLVSVTVFSDGGAKYVHVKEVYVKPGDTLWSIAEAQYDSRVDIREAVYAIKECNDLSDGIIYVGQTILIPEL